MGERESLYWVAYLISLVLSVVWNFTFNRKFTFKAANNVPLAMCLVVLYYCAFTPLSTFGADAIVAAGVNEMLVTVSMMVLNFITEFFWDKFVVFNAKVTDAIERFFKNACSRKGADELTEEELAAAAAESGSAHGGTAESFAPKAVNTPPADGTPPRDDRSEK